MIQKYNCLIVALLLCFAPGCAPVLSQTMVDKSVAISFQEARQAPERYVGKIIILGGTIINAVGTRKGVEWEVLQRPLGHGMEPLVNDTTGGRFLVQSDTMPDMNLFKKGRKIVFAAEIIGNETRSLDQTQYTYLVLRMKEFHLWQEVERWQLPNLWFSFGTGGPF